MNYFPPIWRDNNLTNINYNYKRNNREKKKRDQWMWPQTSLHNMTGQRLALLEAGIGVGPGSIPASGILLHVFTLSHCPPAPSQLSIKAKKQ